MTSRTKPITPLRAILDEEGRKHIWLANKVGIDKSRLSLIVNGLHVDDATQAAIASALGRHVDEVFPSATRQEAA